MKRVGERNARRVCVFVYLFCCLIVLLVFVFVLAKRCFRVLFEVCVCVVAPRALVMFGPGFLVLVVVKQCCLRVIVLCGVLLVDCVFCDAARAEIYTA